MKLPTIFFIFLIVFLLAPIASATTWSVNGINGTTYISNVSYAPNEGYVPIHVWSIIFIGGIVFLILSLLVDRAEVVTSFIAALLFGTSAYASLVLIIPSEITMIEFTNVSEYAVSVLQPAVYYVGSIWLSVLCIALFIIAALRAFFGYSNMLLKAGMEAESEGEIAIGPKLGGIESVNLPDMRDVANGRHGLKNNRFRK